LNYALFVEKPELSFSSNDLHKFNEKILKNANRSTGVVLEYFPEQQEDENQVLETEDLEYMNQEVFNFSSEKQPLSARSSSNNSDN